MKQLKMQVRINDDRSIDLSQEQKNQIKDFYNKLASKQKEIPPEFEATFRKNIKNLFAKF